MLIELSYSDLKNIQDSLKTSYKLAEGYTEEERIDLMELDFRLSQVTLDALYEENQGAALKKGVNLLDFKGKPKED